MRTRSLHLTCPGCEFWFELPSPEELERTHTLACEDCDSTIDYAKIEGTIVCRCGGVYRKDPSPRCPLCDARWPRLVRRTPTRTGSILDAMQAAP